MIPNESSSESLGDLYRECQDGSRCDLDYPQFCQPEDADSELTSTDGSVPKKVCIL